MNKFIDCVLCFVYFADYHSINFRFWNVKLFAYSKGKIYANVWASRYTQRLSQFDKAGTRKMTPHKIFNTSEQGKLKKFRMGSYTN